MGGQVLAEALESLADLLEAKAHKGLKHPRHRKHIVPAIREAKRILSDYFTRQQHAVLAHARPALKAAMVMTEAAAVTPKGWQFARKILPSTIVPLRFPVTEYEESDWDGAISQAIRGAGLTLIKELGEGGKVSEDLAGKYLLEHSLKKLTGNFSDTSIQRLREAVAEAWEQGGSYNQIVEAIQETFAEFSDTRAGMIAQTEVNDAYNAGRMAQAFEMGFEEKAWDPDGEACEEICTPNVDQGWIDMDEDFDSGDDAPPAHPNCDCGISFRKSKGSD